MIEVLVAALIVTGIWGFVRLSAVYWWPFLASYTHGIDIAFYIIVGCLGFVVFLYLLAKVIDEFRSGKFDSKRRKRSDKTTGAKSNGKTVQNHGAKAGTKNAKKSAKNSGKHR